MASLIRFGVIRAFNSTLIKSIPTNVIKRPSPISLMRCINTSSRPPQASASTTSSPTTTTQQSVEEQNKDDENWISYGVSNENKEDDRFVLHSTFFVGITIVVVLGGTVIAYMPDPNDYEWKQREAYIRLRYREENGLPLVGVDLIDPSKFTLPTDEELGDTEIII